MFRRLCHSATKKTNFNNISLKVKFARSIEIRGFIYLWNKNDKKWNHLKSHEIRENTEIFVSIP